MQITLHLLHLSQRLRPRRVPEAVPSQFLRVGVLDGRGQQPVQPEALTVGVASNHFGHVVPEPAFLIGEERRRVRFPAAVTAGCAIAAMTVTAALMLHPVYLRFVCGDDGALIDAHAACEETEQHCEDGRHENHEA